MRPRTDRGSSIIEILITITLTGVVIVPIMAAVQTGIRASSIAAEAAEIETALINAADRVNRAPKKCDYTVYAQAAVMTQGWEARQASVTQRYFEPGPTAGSGTWVDGDADHPGCSGDAPTDLLVQLVTITITGPHGDVTRTVEVVKSDV